MPWTVLFAGAFEPEFRALPEEAQEALVATLEHLREFGPRATRPQVGTLKGSAYANMKELRFHTATGEWRAAFAFDPLRQAIVLVCGSKSGESQSVFYKWLIDTADRRFAAYLEWLAEEEARKKTLAKKPK